jgi:dolichol kinase
MSTAELGFDRELTLDLHRLLSDIDAARWRDEMAGAFRQKLEVMTRQMEHRRRLQPLREALVTEVPKLPTGPGEVASRWLAFKQRMQPAYAAVAEALRAEEIHVPSLRPTNYRRSLFHVSSALVALAVIELLPSSLVLTGAIIWALFAWSCEVSRRVSPRVNTVLMRFFGPVAHEHESHRVNSATWYASALVLLALTHNPALCAVAVMVLGVGDPMAALIGRRFGKTRLIHGRSLEGTLAFVASGALVSFAVLRLLHAASFSLGTAALMAVAAAVAGAIAELVSLRVDDNFSIPMAAALGSGLVMFLS